MNDKTEQELIQIAHGADVDQANLAMKILRAKFNPTYHFCQDWDQMARIDEYCDCLS